MGGDFADLQRLVTSISQLAVDPMSLDTENKNFCGRMVLAEWSRFFSTEAQRHREFLIAGTAGLGAGVRLREVLWDGVN